MIFQYINRGLSPFASQHRSVFQPRVNPWLVNEDTCNPTQKECSLSPHCFAALVAAKWRVATAATKDESSPPDNSTPNGTSVINLFMTACIIQTDHITNFTRKKNTLNFNF